MKLTNQVLYLIHLRNQMYKTGDFAKSLMMEHNFFLEEKDDQVK
jgi:hypothetical protein